MKISTQIICFFFFLFLIIPVNAENIIENNVIIVIDCSHNMLKYWGKNTKIDHLKNGLKSAFNKTAEKPAWGFNMGLVTFGDKSNKKINDCHDSRVVIALEWFDAITLNSAIEGLKPQGLASISYAIENASNAFKRTRNNSYKYMIVITASKNECRENSLDSAINSVIGRLNAIHFIGLDLNTKTQQIYESASKISKGLFVNVTNPSELEGILYSIINENSRYPISKQNQEKESSTQKKSS